MEGERKAPKEGLAHFLSGFIYGGAALFLSSLQNIYWQWLNCRRAVEQPSGIIYYLQAVGFSCLQWSLQLSCFFASQ